MSRAGFLVVGLKHDCERYAAPCVFSWKFQWTNLMHLQHTLLESHLQLPTPSSKYTFPLLSLKGLVYFLIFNAGFIEIDGYCNKRGVSYWQSVKWIVFSLRLTRKVRWIAKGDIVVLCEQGRWSERLASSCLKVLNPWCRKACHPYNRCRARADNSTQASEGSLLFCQPPRNMSLGIFFSAYCIVFWSG